MHEGNNPKRTPLLPLEYMQRNLVRRRCGVDNYLLHLEKLVGAMSGLLWGHKPHRV